MRWSELERHFVTGVALPPYREVRPLPAVPARTARGSLLVVEVRVPGEGWTLLPEAVDTLRGLYPAAPVILRMEQVTPQTMRLALGGGRLDVRAVVGRDEPLGDALRPQLTSARHLADDLFAWLAFRGWTFSARVLPLLRGMVELAPGYPVLGDLLRVLGAPERTVRHRLPRTDGPGPRQWHQLARALHATLRLQAEPGGRLLPLALELGYSDHSGLTRHLSRTFGVTPAGIRGTLGWEWLAERWVARNERIRMRT